MEIADFQMVIRTLAEDTTSCWPCAGSGVDRTDPLHFLAGCHEK